jgi:hypothetical protein
MAAYESGSWHDHAMVCENHQWKRARKQGKPYEFKVFHPYLHESCCLVFSQVQSVIKSNFLLCLLNYSSIGSYDGNWVFATVEQVHEQGAA